MNSIQLLKILDEKFGTMIKNSLMKTIMNIKY